MNLYTLKAKICKVVNSYMYVLVISAESANLYLAEKLGIYPHGKDAVVTSVSDWVISHIPQGDKYK